MANLTWTERMTLQRIGREGGVVAYSTEEIAVLEALKAKGFVRQPWECWYLTDKARLLLAREHTREILRGVGAFFRGVRKGLVRR